MNEVIHVAVAAIVNQNNEVLISRRAEGSHQGGLWEFPGGKIEKNETVEQAMVREVREELGIHLISFRPLIKVRHQYVDRKIVLDVWKVADFTGNPTGLEGQPVRWQPINKLDELEFPEADAPIAQALNLPEHYLITGKFETEQEFERRLLRAISGGIRLVQLRLTEEWLSKSSKSFAMSIIEIAVRLSEKSNFILMFNLPDAMDADMMNTFGNIFIESPCSYGIHLNSNKLCTLNKKPDCHLLSASCHNLPELKKAQYLNVDFAVLSPVKVTASHPEMQPLGWSMFSELVDQVDVPVYALGGVKREDTEKAWLTGGQGIAAISNIWLE